MGFGDAMKQVMNGMQLRRTRWLDSQRYVFLDRDVNHLRIVNGLDDDERCYTWNWYPTQPDMVESDWEIVMPETRPRHPGLV
jgi:hypothetical protein